MSSIAALRSEITELRAEIHQAVLLRSKLTLCYNTFHWCEQTIVSAAKNLIIYYVAPKSFFTALRSVQHDIISLLNVKIALRAHGQYMSGDRHLVWGITPKRQIAIVEE